MLIRSACLLALGACVDEPVWIAPPGGGPPVERLSELGLFAGPPADQVPAAGVVPYDVIAPLWSDGASKHRFVLAPAPLAVTDDHWTVPDGTYLVKTFFVPRDARDPAAGVQLLETRVIAFAGAGFSAATYVWDEAQRDAIASGGNLDLPVTWIDADGVTRHQLHHVPGTSQCDTCHAGGALGMRTPQLAAQLESLVAAGVADRLPDAIDPFVDPYGDGPLEARATSYLDSNCAHCHRPGGDAQGTHADWRRAHVRDNICRDADHRVDGHARVIDPGRPAASVAIARMRSTDPYVHMPRGPSHVIDARGVAVVSDWIASLPEGCP